VLAVDPVDTWGRALAAGAVLAGVDASVLARLGGGVGEAARAQLAAWAAASTATRAAAVATAVAGVRAPVPAGADRVDRSWSEPAFDDDPRARAAWERGGDGGDGPIAVWWQRGVSARWVALPAEDAGARVAAPADLARWPAAAITRACRRVSLAVLAHVTLEAGDAAVARLAAAIVDGAEVVALARRLRADAALRAGMPPVRACAAAIRGRDPGAELGVGAAAIGRHLAGDAGVQVRLLLPVAVAHLLDDDGLAIPWDAIRDTIASR
jgi:hypothetical protein